MSEMSPLRRAAEQPPCDSNAEALALVGMFAVPGRMAHYDLTPHLVCFVEHITIWRSMRRVVDGPSDEFWWRTFKDLERERSAAEVRDLLNVLHSAYASGVSDSVDGWLIFLLAMTTLERCTAARRELQDIQARGEVLYRVPNEPYTADEKVRLFGTGLAPTIRVDIA